MQLTYDVDSHLDLEHEGVQLCRYVYRPGTAAIESPRPYFHPIRTLKGNVVSGFRPHDHRWHHGLSMTSAYLSGHNFWGGPTYVHGEGYKQLDNNGRQFACFVNGFGADYFNHSVDWMSPTNAEDERVVFEERETSFLLGDGFWNLNLRFQIFNHSGGTLRWGSPTTQGRELAGYGGLFWRGPRDFLGGKILMSDGREGVDLMGEKSRWLAYIGQHDGCDDSSTLIFIDNSIKKYVTGRSGLFATRRRWFVLILLSTKSTFESQ